MGDLGPDLRGTDFGVCLLWSLPGAAVPRESPPDLARLWHGELRLKVRGWPQCLNLWPHPYQVDHWDLTTSADSHHTSGGLRAQVRG